MELPAIYDEFQERDLTTKDTKFHEGTGEHRGAVWGIEK